MTDWTFTFCDMVTGVELATLPLTNVKYTRAVRSVGTFDAFLHLADQKIRALNPWAASRPRRTTVYAEYGDECVWGGPVLSRAGGASSEGMRLSAVSWEGWLHRQRLLDDVDLRNMTRLEVVEMLLYLARQPTAQGDPNVLPFPVIWERQGGSGLDDFLFLATEVKPILELIDTLVVDGEVPLEWRIDCRRDPDTGRLGPVMVLGEPRVGRRFEDTQLTYAFNYNFPEGGLVDWNLAEDGSGADNYLLTLGSGSGPAQPFEIVTDTDVRGGDGELGSGYPTWMGNRSYSDIDDWELMRARGAEDLRAGLTSEFVFSGVKLRADAYLGLVDPGDDLALEITHPRLEEWPDTVSYLTRVLGETVTVGDGGKADSVSLTIGGTP